MDEHSATNTCSCGEHSSMMAVFGLIESGRVVDAGAGTVAALGLCKCDEALEFLPHVYVGSCMCMCVRARDACASSEYLKRARFDL